jgi:transposase
MRVVRDICCGMDVHKKSVTVCLLKTGAQGELVKEIRTYPTMTASLRQLRDWLKAEGCQHVAMESTGVYWRPIHNLLEGEITEVLLVNAQHIKNVPGRKTDVKDAEWIADLVRHGLVRGSFIPTKDIRELRALTRYRTTVVRELANECNRIQKLLETCNIKLASVATDVLGVSGKAMLEALCAGATDPEQLADMAKGKLRHKIPQLQQALDGMLSETHRWLLHLHLQQVDHFDQVIAELDTKIEALTRPFAELIERLDEIPGVNRRIAEIIIAEMGPEMKQFPSAAHAASWTGLCPGHNESGGKRYSGKTRKGNQWLRTALVEAGWAAGRCKTSYLSAHYHNILRRRGKKRACVAVGHSILVMAYTVVAKDIRYQDLGPDYLDNRSKEAKKHSLVRQLEKLGFTVTLEAVTAA